MTALPGMPGAMPPEVKDEYQKAGRPCERAAIVHHFVPEDIFLYFL